MTVNCRKNFEIVKKSFRRKWRVNTGAKQWGGVRRTCRGDVGLRSARVQRRPVRFGRQLRRSGHRWGRRVLAERVQNWNPVGGLVGDFVWPCGLHLRGRGGRGSTRAVGELIVVHIFDELLNLHCLAADVQVRVHAGAVGGLLRDGHHTWDGRQRPLPRSHSERAALPLDEHSASVERRRRGGAGGVLRSPQHNGARKLWRGRLRRDHLRRRRPRVRSVREGAHDPCRVLDRGELLPAYVVNNQSIALQIHSYI